MRRHNHQACYASEQQKLDMPMTYMVCQRIVLLGGEFALINSF